MLRRKSPQYVKILKFITVLNLPVKYQGETLLFRKSIIIGKGSLRGDGTVVEAVDWKWLNASLG